MALVELAHDDEEKFSDINLLTSPFLFNFNLDVSTQMFNYGDIRK